jgi:hypothetical protein
MKVQASIKLKASKLNDYLQQWEGGPGPDLAARNISNTAPSPSSSQPADPSSPASGLAAAASTLRICRRNRTSSADIAILADVAVRAIAAARISGDANSQREKQECYPAFEPEVQFELVFFCMVVVLI